MAVGTFTCRMTPTGNSLSIGALYAAAGVPLPSTPGCVGVCLSGGGSRALSAGMGQLRALRQLSANGASLLGQVRALSTVSGGSWLGVPFTFLPSTAASDDAYLGPYVADQAALTPAQLALLPAGNAGVPISSELFGLELLALEALILYEVLGVAPGMLWQSLMALHILAAHGLSSPTAKLTPTDSFTLDAVTRGNSVTDPAAEPPLNPTLADEPIDEVADAPGRVPRPFLICNAAMFLDGAAVLRLAPVQTSGLLTGVVGTPAGTDANGLPVGGGMITSFAFNSVFARSAGDSAVVAQTRQWSLTDAVGTSSAAFADALQNQFAIWESNPLEFAAEIAEYFDELLQWIRSHLPADRQEPARALLRRYVRPGGGDALSIPKFSFPSLQDLIPSYHYWSPAHPATVLQPVATRFADGGSLENTGILGMLAYSDIDRLIAFVNTEVPMQAAPFGVVDGQGGWIPGSGFIVDECIPPLFGFKPYEAGGPGEVRGYVPYSNTTNSDYSGYAHNQVFASSEFPALLRGLAAAAGPDLVAGSAMFTQELTVLPNAWFGVAGGKTVTVFWSYLNFVQGWADQFANNPAVAALVRETRLSAGFPHYDTLDTALTPIEINLLSHLTCWSVIGQAGILSQWFTPA